MGMSTHVIGLRSADSDEYRKHAAVLTACLKADIQELPKETAKFFGSKYPSESLFEDALTVNLDKCTREYSEDMSVGVEIDVKKIPAGVETIRFVNSW